MGRRDEFSAATKALIADRTGSTCSYPGCGIQTLGPAAGSTCGVTNVGVAAHICAAAAGGPRYDPTMTQEVRRSAANGIWMCQVHGTQVDSTDTRFTVPILQAWKRRAEDRAQLIVGRSTSVDTDIAARLLRATEYAVEVRTHGALNEHVGFALDAASVAEAWGQKAAPAIRDLLIEVGRNAFQHGGATRVQLAIHPRHLELSDDGRQFDLTTLGSVGRRGGGSLSLQLLRSTCGADLMIGAHLSASGNLLRIVRVGSLDEVKLLEPCIVTFDRSVLYSPDSLTLGTPPSTCQRIHLVVPTFPSISDLAHLVEMLRAAPDLHRYTLVLNRASDGVVAFVTEHLPQIDVVRLGS